jgi:AcrR family transcriptional regulator
MGASTPKEGLEALKTEQIQVPPGRRAGKRAAVVQRILEAARAAVIAHGVNDIDFAEIAEQAQVGRATLYRYFDGKDALLSALMDEDWDRQADHYRQLVESPRLDAAAIAAWLRSSVTAARASTASLQIYHACGRRLSTMNRLTRQRLRLLGVLGARFWGFSSADSNQRMDALLLLFQVEQFIVFAAMNPDCRNIDHAIQTLTAQLAARIKPQEAEDEDMVWSAMGSGGVEHA